MCFFARTDDDIVLPSTQKKKIASALLQRSRTSFEGNSIRVLHDPGLTVDIKKVNLHLPLSFNFEDEPSSPV